MLSSPISITIDGTNHSLTRINQDNFSSLYQKSVSGLEITCAIRHTREGKVGDAQYERHNVDLKYTTFAVDGKPTTYQAYTVLRTIRGLDPEIVENVSAGLNGFVNANAAAIVGWES